MKKLLESTSVDPDVKIITRVQLIQYEQLLLDNNIFRQHLEILMVSKKNLRMATQKSPIHKT